MDKEDDFIEVKIRFKYKDIILGETVRVSQELFFDDDGIFKHIKDLSEVLCKQARTQLEKEK